MEGNTQVSRGQNQKPKHRTTPSPFVGLSLSVSRASYGSARWPPKHTQGFLSCDFDAILLSVSLIQMLIYALLVLFEFMHRKDFSCQIVVLEVSTEKQKQTKGKVNPEVSGGSMENLNLAILIPAKVVPCTQYLSQYLQLESVTFQGPLFHFPSTSGFHSCVYFL